MANQEQKTAVIRIVVNAVIGALTSLATVYLGAGVAESVSASAVSCGALGERFSAIVQSVLA